jgi:RNA polymerase-binding transcription factor DksA
MTIGNDGLLHQLRLALHEQFERHSHELSRLTSQGFEDERDEADRHTVAALAESARQGLADTTEALRRMADGTYGTCQRCRRDIPAERLEILPHARFCVPCQEIRRR